MGSCTDRAISLRFGCAVGAACRDLRACARGGLSRQAAPTPSSPARGNGEFRGKRHSHAMRLLAQPSRIARPELFDAQKLSPATTATRAGTWRLTAQSTAAWRAPARRARRCTTSSATTTWATAARCRAASTRLPFGVTGVSGGRHEFTNRRGVKAFDFDARDDLFAEALDVF